MLRSLRVAGPCAVAIIVFLLPSISAAQAAPVRSDPSGFHLGGFLNGSALQVDGQDVTESGPGAGLAVGYGFNRTLTLCLGAVGANVEMADLADTYALAHVDLGIRLNFRGPQAQALPYVTLAYSGRAAAIDLYGDPFTITGAGPTLGGGVAIFLRRSTAVDIGLSWTAGSFTQAEYQGLKETIDLGAKSARFDVGVSWWAGR